MWSVWLRRSAESFYAVLRREQVVHFDLVSTLRPSLTRISMETRHTTTDPAKKTGECSIPARRTDMVQTRMPAGNAAVHPPE
jgi:hypothetical protein